MTRINCMVYIEEVEEQMTELEMSGLNAEALEV